jgi:hypothetical protein
MLGFNGNSDPASHVERSSYPTPMGFEGFHQVIEDGVGDMFMEHALIAIRP